MGGWTVLDDVWDRGFEFGEMMEEMGRWRLGVKLESEEKAVGGEAAFPYTRSFMFREHRSTMDADDAVAYFDLVSSLAVFATTYLHDAITSHIKRFRAIAGQLDEGLWESLTRLCALFKVNDSTVQYYKARFPDQIGDLKQEQGTGAVRKGQVERGTDQDEPSVVGQQEDEQDETSTTTKAIPFDRLVDFIQKRRRREEAYTPMYIHRYTVAGGFDAVSKKKLYALMNEEDKNAAERKKAQDG
ncbi:hypothetical protein M011DRAFT_471216 [Sporormia fimetaria CBS 119925]|uniref:Uncharacterized protein n=1 Tax=Sporormia fimetaria CBS 119925 TaxID=1340428 RepID=A0A6A6V231_9PLEO|nr:hypothetical protein M011DRAFT_471216 [Sporormia fimetaria CBS 119925]